MLASLQGVPSGLTKRVSSMLARIAADLDKAETKIGPALHLLDTDEDGRCLALLLSCKSPLVPKTHSNCLFSLPSLCQLSTQKKVISIKNTMFY